MTKKELTSVYYIKKEIKMWEEQLELIESKAEGKAMQITGLPFTPGAGSSDPMADLAIKAVSVRELIEVKKEKAQSAAGQNYLVDYINRRHSHSTDYVVSSCQVLFLEHSCTEDRHYSRQCTQAT